MAGNWFFYWQRVGGEDTWELALAEQREHVVATEKPRFVTVLDLDSSIEEGWTREQIEQVKYRGPLYFDFDGPDIEDVLVKARILLGKLVELDVDPRALRLYATGGRGFHFEVPWEIFIPKAPKHGVQRLPAIYKEIAYELYVDTLDLRVYSGRKGRMWRTPNVRRESGKYKVPITPEELMEMSAEDYQALCSQPRIIPAPAAPVLSQKLAVLYAKAEAKIEAASKKRKDSKKDFELLAKFKGQFPPSLAAVMAGTVVPTVGFHSIALQVTITANALGKSEEEMLALCEGLIEKHQSDSTRYNTPAKRREELKRLYRYTQGNPCYEYSRDAIKRMLPIGAAGPDMDGLIPEVSGEVTAEGVDGNDEGMLSGVFVTEKGIFVRTAAGALKISDVSFRDVRALCRVEKGEPYGYEAEILLRGEPRGRQMISLECFSSKKNFLLFCNAAGGPFQGTDGHAQALYAILRDTAMKNNNVVYVVQREGLDIIQRPGVREKILDMLWVSPEKVVTKSPCAYTHRGNPNPEGVFKSDLMYAPNFKADDRSAALIHSLMRFNDPYAVANLLGWFVSAFHRQLYHHLPDKAFPLLQIFGQSGAGKTQTVKALIRLFYFLEREKITPATDSTLHAIRTMVQSSASIPVVLDEFKPKDFGPGKYGGLVGVLRSTYDATEFGKGGMAEGLGSNTKDIRMMGFSAPVMFMTEALEPQTAILERCVVVPLSKASLSGRREHHMRIKEESELMASLGKAIVEATFGLGDEKNGGAVDRGRLVAFRQLLEANRKRVVNLPFNRDNDRPVFNLSVVLTGLDFLQQVIHIFFESQFDEDFNLLRTAAMDVTKHTATAPMPEAGKVLNVLAHMSKTEPSDSECYLDPAKDFLIRDSNLELNMRTCYYKYVMWLRKRGQVPLYDNEEAFLQGLGNYAPLVSRSNLGSPMKETGAERIYSFSIAKMKEEGIEKFSGMTEA